MYPVTKAMKKIAETKLKCKRIKQIFLDDINHSPLMESLDTVSDAVNFRFKHCGRAPRGVRGVKRSKISCHIRFWQFEVLIFSQN